MSRVSSGIILAGNPNRVQQPTAWLNIANFIFKFSWIISGITMVLTFILAFASNDGDMLDFSFSLIIPTLPLFLGYIIWTDDRRCPYCHHFLAGKRISDNKTIKVTSKEISRRVDNPHSGLAFDFSGNSVFYTGHSSHREYGSETTETYTYNMRCCECGCVYKVIDSKTKKIF